MKKTLLLLLCGVAVTSVAQNIYFPDANFKSALLLDRTLNSNGDSQITIVEATAFTGELSVSNKSITDLTGIEEFVNITGLSCYNNQLTSLDVSKNTALTKIVCNQNQLTSLDVSNNTALTILYSYSNPDLRCIKVNNLTQVTASWSKDAAASYSTTCGATVIDEIIVPEYVNIPDPNFKAALVSNLSINTDEDTEISVAEAEAYNLSLSVSSRFITDLTGIEAFVNITSLYCQKNKLTSLDVSQNTALVTLHCYNNELESIDLSSNTVLKYFYADGNKFTSLDVSNNTVLKELVFQNNEVTSIVVSNKPDLTKISCHHNKLSSLDVSNNLVLGQLYATNNPDLTCIKVNDLDKITSYWQKDDAASFSLSCGSELGLFSFQEQNQSLSIYPNPATSTIYVAEGEIQVFDQLGNLIITAVSNGKVDISTLESGVYIVVHEGKKSKLIIE